MRRLWAEITHVGRQWPFARVGRGRGVGVATILASAVLVSAAPAQVITELPSADGASSSITAGPDGNLWFTEPRFNRIGRLTPAGVITYFSEGISPRAWPIDIAAGPDGNLWFTENDGHRIGRITPSGQVTEFSAGLTPLSKPRGITAGPDGSVWFTEDWANQIGRITPDGSITEFGAGMTEWASPTEIVTGTDGNLWFTEWHADRIGKITPGGQITEYPLRMGANPWGIAAAANGDLWFTENGASSNRIGRISPSGAVTEFGGLSAFAQPFNIALDGDQGVWFTLNSGIGRLSEGRITEFEAGIAPGAHPAGIALGPDGDIWFTEMSAPRIGHVALGARFTPLAPCRMLDTRSTPAAPLRANEERLLATRGVCGIPVGARAIAVNLTVAQPGAPGALRIYPHGSSTVSTVISFRPGLTRANNAHAKLGADGLLGISNDAGGDVHLIVDVSGYYR